MGRRRVRRRRHPRPEEETTERRRPWADLVPADVLYLVALRLLPPDFSSFRKVCKLWRSICVESHPLGRSPLLFSYRPGDDDLHLYSPLYGKTFSLAADGEALGVLNSPMSMLMLSQDGWLVFFNYDEPGNPAIVFVNPLLRPPAAASVVRWRAPKYLCSSAPASVSAPPTDPACIFLLINPLCCGIEMVTGKEGGRNWRVDVFRFRIARPFAFSNPVFHGGVFYSLSLSNGTGSCSCDRLCVYDPRRRTLAIHCLGINVDGREDRFLVESNGELLVVFKFYGAADHGKADHVVYKLNESSMEWEEWTDLRGRALFLDERSAISATPEVEWMKDRIFYHMFAQDENATKKADCELLRSGGGCPGGGGGGGNQWRVPRRQAGMADLGTRAEGETVERSHRYNYFLDGPSMVGERGRAAGPTLDGLGFDRRRGEELEAGEGKEREPDEDEPDEEVTFWMRAGIWVQPNWGQ